MGKYNEEPAKAGIHFCTQWFETLGASPATVLLAGTLALGLKAMNGRMRSSRSKT